VASIDVPSIVALVHSPILFTCTPWKFILYLLLSSSADKVLLLIAKEQNIAIRSSFGLSFFIIVFFVEEDSFCKDKKKIA